MNHMVLPLSILCLIILLLIFLLKKLHQPYLAAYILAGVLMGPHVTGVFTNTQQIAQVGELGVLLLMFFLGMEIDIPDRKALLLSPLVGQGVKTVLSFVFALLVAWLMRWNRPALILLTVLLAFNSTAVVSDLLRRNGLLHAPIGRTILNMLLLQDIMLAPVLTLFQLMGHQQILVGKLLSAIAGSVLIFLLLRAIRNRNLFQLPLLKEMDQDHDLQVFLGAAICLGFALLASAIGLSGPVGSFAAGIFIGRMQAFHWLEKVLHPFRVFFVALYFVSVGLMIDLAYLKTHYLLVFSITMLVMCSNSLFSALTFRLLRFPWLRSFQAGALLSQTGEFGILAASVAWGMGVIDEPVFKVSVAVTGLSLLLSTAWMAAVSRWLQGHFPDLHNNET